MFFFHIFLVHFIAIAIYFFPSDGINFENASKYSNYDKLVNIDKQMIQFLPAETKIKEVYQDTNLVYAVNAKQLEEYAADFDSCMVYLWNTWCNGWACVLPNVVVKYSKSNNYHLIVVLQDYTEFGNVRNSMVTFRPMFSINERYYNTNVQLKYLNLFKSDLSIPSDEEDKTISNFWVFKKGKFERSIDTKLIIGSKI